ncbi:hypothetical protein, conserved, partial [Babesia bigemina]
MTSKALDGIDSKLISLGHLAGQLGGFVGQSESVKKAVENAIIAVINSNEELKNDYSSHVTILSESVKPAGKADDNLKISELKDKVTTEITLTEEAIKNLKPTENNSLPSPSPSAELAKLHSKLEALRKVEKLCGFYENLNTKQNDPKKLLDNLCSGLEKFLGFNSDSKGYTGQGIVYSDLDRLGDGVMGFLSGVLSNIKGHLGQHKGTLNDAIYTLNTNKHAGKKGFNAAIESVVAGVRGYNGNVKTSNDLVKTAIKKLQRDMKNYKKEELQTKLPNNINPKRPTASTQESVEKAMSLVEDCRKFAKDFITAVDIKTNKSETINAIKDLNPKLRDTIENVRKNLQHESKRLKELSSKESEKLKATEEKIKKALGDLKCNVNNRIDVQVNELVNHLRKLVKENILPKLQEVDTNLFKYVETLQEWITEADGILKIALEKVKKILQEVNWDDQTKFPRQIVQASDLMNILLQGNAEELQKWRDAAGSVVSAAKEKCKTIGGMVETGTAGSDKIHGLAKDMHDKAEKLRKAAQHIKDNIGTWVRTALTQVKDMDEALKGDLYKVKEAVDGQVTEIKTAIGKLYDKFDAYGRGLQNKEEDKKKVEEVIKHFKIQVAGIRGNAKG